MVLITKIVFWVSLPLAILGWWQRNEFVPVRLTEPALVADPVQKEVRKKSFQIEFNSVPYNVVPKHAYDLYGMVVSYRYHDGDEMLHKMWNDHLNVADVCVVWGTNMDAVNLNAFEFYNGQFTCNFSTRDQLAWQQFSQREISNNHLLTERPELRERITDLNIGDVIRVRGLLSWYGQVGRSEEHMRKTSISRGDTGNGACEIIYVEQFDILQQMPNRWRRVFNVAGIAALLSALVWLVGVGTGRFKHAL